MSPPVDRAVATSLDADVAGRRDSLVPIVEFLFEDDSDVATTVADLVLPAATLGLDTPVTEAHRQFMARRDLWAIAVVDDGARPLGLVNRFKLFEWLSQEHDLLSSHTSPVSSVMDIQPLVVDENALADQRDIFVEDHLDLIEDSFVVTRHGRYLGIASRYALIRRLGQRRQSALFKLAHQDVLTGLPNRQLFLDRLHQAFAAAKRNRRILGTLYIDLDNFKQINDQRGHATGDLLLQMVADRLRKVTREQDTVARLGGDEFAMVLTELREPANAELVARLVVRALREPYIVNDEEVDATCSVGIAVYPDDVSEEEDLVRAADDALYAAKRTRGLAMRFLPKMQRVAPQRSPSINVVRRAIDLKQLDVHYQPQADVRTGNLYGLEALVRWRDRTSGLSTLELVRVAEDSGLISAITEHVLDSAMRQVNRWQRMGIADGLRLSVNVSGLEVNDRVLAPMVRRCARDVNFDLSTLEIELTESVLMRSEAAASAVLSELRREGVRVSVDDFGTGYSSLARLQNLKVDALKIDRTFVEGIEHDRGALAAAIITIARALELSVVAEGVEQQHQLDFLRAHDCDFYQGYLLSRPLDPRAMGQFLAATAAGVDPANERAGSPETGAPGTA